MTDKELLEHYSDISDDDLIETWMDMCEPPANDLRYYATAPALLTFREIIYLRGLEDKDEVKNSDKQLIECVLAEGSYPPDSDDPSNFPFSHWWWHLEEIGKKTYPPELLPDYLREIYLDALNKDS